ncbi:hypothetical protein BDR26DRAFT_866544 [Obelidium mucronatum]|nr:hypothetical protein BDR26DRAFT_866544 [Obelidium mucronatum]
MSNFTADIEHLFETRDMRPANNLYYTTPSVESFLSHYPDSELRYAVNTSLFEYTKTFSNSGFYAANVDFADFKFSDQDNSVRWILDNFWTAQNGPYDYSMNVLYFTTFNIDISNANQTIYILTGINVFIIFAFLVVLDRSVRTFLTNQRHSLNIFRSIPKAIIKRLSEADSGDIFSSSIIKQSHQVSTANAVQTSSAIFRIQYAMYAVCMSILSILFAYVNISSIYTIGKNFAILDQAGDMQTYQVRLTNLANELSNVDLKTWGTEKNLREAFLEDYERITSVYDAVKFGDASRYPPSPSYNTYSPTLLWLITDAPCLPYNKSACLPENRQWNSSIGYTPNSVGLGLMHLTDSIMRLNSDIANSCEAENNQPSKNPPNPKPLAYFEKVVEWDYLDGWNHIEEETFVETVGMLNNSIHLNIAIFVLEMVLVFFGQFLVVSRMMSNFRFTDQCIFDLLNRLPAQVKNVPEIAELLVNNGIMPKGKTAIEEESLTKNINHNLQRHFRNLCALRQETEQCRLHNKYNYTQT